MLRVFKHTLSQKLCARLLAYQSCFLGFQGRELAYSKTISVDPVAGLHTAVRNRVYRFDRCCSTDGAMAIGLGKVQVEVPGQADGSTSKSSRLAPLLLDEEKQSGKPGVGQCTWRGD